jgi:hypothetical protein
LCPRNTPSTARAPDIRRQQMQTSQEAPAFAETETNSNTRRRGVQGPRVQERPSRNVRCQIVESAVKIKSKLIAWHHIIGGAPVSLSCLAHTTSLSSSNAKPVTHNTPTHKYMGHISAQHTRTPSSVLRDHP